MIRRATPIGALNALNRVLLISGSIVAFGLILFAGRAILLLHTIGRLKATSRSVQVQLDAVKAQSAAGAVGQSQLPVGLATVDIIHQALQHSAGIRHCSVTEFKSGTDTTPFLTHYRREASDAGWTQVDARFSIEGRLADVIETVRSLEGCSVPFEIDSININRQNFDKTGGAIVSADVQFRTIWQGASA